eukprot:s5681_g3.t1
MKLNWPHAAEFQAASDEDWKLDGRTVGKLRSSNGLNFMQVYEAGHMVPMDQPKVALQMMSDFVYGKLGKPSATTEEATLRGSAFCMAMCHSHIESRAWAGADGKLAPATAVKGVWPPAPCMAKVRGLN